MNQTRLHVIVTLVLVIIFTTSYCAGDILPSYASGKYVHEVKWVVEIRIGTIRKNIKAVIDRTSGVLTTTFNIDKVVSKSYSVYAGGSDRVLIGEKNVLFKHEVNPSLPSALGCPECQAVLGVGSGSPINFHFDKVLYTPGSILLDETTDSFEYLSDGYGYVKCKLAMPEICVTTGVLFGSHVTVVFGANEDSLLLPPELFKKYTDGKSLNKNAPSEWDDITITFPVIPNSGNENVLTIQRENLVSPSNGDGHHLLVDISPIPDTVIIGRAARMNVMIEVDQSKSIAKITSIEISKHYSIAGLLAGIVVALIFEFWRQTPTGTWEDFNFSSPYKIASLVITIVASVVFYSAEEYQAVLKPFPVVNVYVGVVVFGMIICAIGVILMYFTSSSRDILGWVVKDKRVLLGTLSGEESSSRESRLSSELRIEDYIVEPHDPVAVPDTIRPRKKRQQSAKETAQTQKASMDIKERNQKRKDIVKYGSDDDDFGFSSLHFGAPTNGKQQDDEGEERLGRVAYEKVYFNARLWIMASITVETVLLTITFLIVEETRAEGLWGLAGTLFILYILYQLMYNAFIILNLPKGNVSFVWTGFVVYLFLVIIATLVVAQRYVVGPTVERLFVTEEFLSILGSATLYLIVLYWSIWSAVSTLLLIDKKLAVLLRYQENK